ncbi:MAG: phosphate/phosphite/phosphonate ABC transporter substrate-binding protein [Nostoc sp. DedVER02]|uniref:phosphate/phosphite/phosphonate ABC transporter substrate-binding protein n=1 Tax=unclassified Nostoc TaxID=2593658 RepID=UPI002AD2ED1B|nr:MULTISPECIES: PhnD/SsuA/transferrin family substrate-binding protein [unclassified Nostoc]MDZ7989489.1 PhnD/SsuA/transferrin family substrate-binding protein [Nostoc sp. DedVER02]MDZ8114586.1 PhnD/SsuA/transferrin family substrate-binding protein [Nostoc sp. DedVER01b]
MSLRFSRRLFLFHLLGFTFTACKPKNNFEGALTIGAINYGGGEQIINQYAKFNTYLGEKTNSYIQLEPVFNENRAVERLNARAWSLVFAPPGLAAIAIARHQYSPLFPLIGISNLRSIFVVRKDSPITELKQLQGKTLALGQLGSATGYYFPLYNLYGTTLAEILFAPTPKAALELVAQGKAIACAVSEAELSLYASQFAPTEFRILFKDPHYVPLGVVLIGPNIERNRQEFIRKVMSDAPSGLAQEVGYVANGQVPDYKYMISVVDRVSSITSKLQKKPVQLF